MAKNSVNTSELSFMMQSGKKKFRHESLQDNNMLADMLRSVADGLKSGELTFSDENGDIIMQPDGLMHFKLRAQKKNGHNQFAFEVSWQDPFVVEDKEPQIKVIAGD
ncbi:amphi-Trp domain-containing protein [Enterovibrio coralii]|uniref:Amphi-Trp domain-containing protein n=1 Tax=Enterovibrio coralii TaxID=294935 RepID=A0A135I8T4_9GAMM|nr:amphi-Trp domain-containing protein [Enterovibrio coralii]KXF81869.1 hypothetical protein ATN88_20480 [Enterovibrio coralii]